MQIFGTFLNCLLKRGRVVVRPRRYDIWN